MECDNLMNKVSDSNIDDLFKDDQSPNVVASEVPPKLPEEMLFNNIQAPHHSVNAVDAFDNPPTDHSLLLVPRKQCIPWTAQEHKLFLIGLVRYGPGRWKEISENIVLTRTPSQIASHAQKYFIRQKIPKNERKRRSIHDMTFEDLNLMVPHHIDQQNWIPPIPNIAMQPQQGMQQAQNLMQFSNDPLHIYHQNSGTRNIYDTTLRDMDVMIPPHIDQQNWIPPIPNIAMQPQQGMQQAQNVMQFSNDPLHIYHQNSGTRNIYDTTLRDMDVMIPPHIDQQNWVAPNFAMQQQQIVQQEQDVMQFNSGPHQSNGIGFLGYNLPSFHRCN